jgi:hypothetical protein
MSSGGGGCGGDSDCHGHEVGGNDVNDAHAATRRDDHDTEGSTTTTNPTLRPEGSVGGSADSLGSDAPQNTAMRWLHGRFGSGEST